MINHISSTCPHLTAVGGSTLPYIQYNPSNPIQGMLRINGTEMEVFTGSAWQKINASSANVGLNTEAESAIDWAIKRMKQEKEWYELATTNEAVRIALDQLEQARTRLELTTTLAKEYEQTTS